MDLHNPKKADHNFVFIARGLQHIYNYNSDIETESASGVVFSAAAAYSQRALSTERTFGVVCVCVYVFSAVLSLTCTRRPGENTINLRNK